MNTSRLTQFTLILAAFTFIPLTGCIVQPYGQVQVAAPGPAVETEVPDDYVWDGYEYVGLVGDQYYYLGPGNVWLECEPFRLERFHGWERGHPDWRGHVTVNVHYRTDHYGHDQPRREVHARSVKRDEHEHDRN